MAHKHATEMLQFAQDAAETEKPWERWEVKLGGNRSYQPLGDMPSWGDNESYRRIAKRRTFVGRLEWLAPMTEAPEEGVPYWYVDLTHGSAIVEEKWNGASFDELLLERGLAFSTEDAARDCLAAMQTFLGGAA